MPAVGLLEGGHLCMLSATYVPGPAMPTLPAALPRVLAPGRQGLRKASSFILLSTSVSGVHPVKGGVGEQVLASAVQPGIGAPLCSLVAICKVELVFSSEVWIWEPGHFETSRGAAALSWACSLPSWPWVFTLPCVCVCIHIL